MSEKRIYQHVLDGKTGSMFNQARKRGWFLRLWAYLTRKCYCLLDLDNLLRCSSTESSSYAGIKTVRIDRIQGTLGKSEEFDSEFNPIQERSRIRWMGVAAQKILGRDLPPVELVQVGETYFIRDGHHRVSVSRALGQHFIDAEITVMGLQLNQTC